MEPIVINEAEEYKKIILGAKKYLIESIKGLVNAAHHDRLDRMTLIELIVYYGNCEYQAGDYADR